MARKKLTEAERAARRAERDRALADAQWLRELAERGKAELNAKGAQAEQDTQQPTE